MNQQKICFIMCSNDKIQADECRLYIEQLLLPEGYEVEVLVVTEAVSMTSGYNEAMNVSDAKYKVYLHHDVLILKPDFLYQLLALFQKHPEIGMFGMVGNESIAKDGGMWSDGTWRRTGEILVDRVYERDYSFFARAEGEFSEVITLDGLLIATQYDIPWREDLFQGWDYYDASQSVEFWKAGYKVVVPYMDAPWCLHENDLLNMAAYDQWRNVFVREYGDFYKRWMEEHPFGKRMPEDYCLENKNENVNEQKFCFIICANNESYLDECLWYIDRLSVPDGFEKETIVVRDASSMTSGYNQAMKQSEAKYKIYLHQDVLVVNQNILTALLEIFQEDSIGMVGVLGKQDFMPAADYTTDWDSGGVEVCNAVRTYYYNYNFDTKDKYLDVVSIDGMFMATQYDLVWDEKNFDGWDFYDISQSVNFAQAGYRLVVPKITRDTLWCFHDSGSCEYYEWDRFRKVFCQINADKGYDYRPLEFVRLNGSAQEKRRLAFEEFEKGDYIKTTQYLQQMAGELTLDTQCSYMLLFLGVLSEELLLLGHSSYVDPRKLPVFINEWDEVKFALRRMYYGADSKETWQIIQDKLLSGKITMRLLGKAVNSCVFDSNRLRKIVFIHFQECIVSLIREGRAESAKQMIAQLKEEELGNKEKLLRNVIRVFQLEQKKGNVDVEQLLSRYVRLEWFIRQIEFGHSEMNLQEFYDFIIQDGVSDEQILEIVKDDVAYRFKVYAVLAALFVKKEGESSERADLYRGLIDSEEGVRLPSLNEKKFCFILCADQEMELKDCQWYIDQILVPEGYEIETLIIRDESAEIHEYDRAKAQTDAKYKVYVQSGVRIVNQNIISDLLEIFQDSSIGMAGVLGLREISQTTAPKEWNAGTVEVCYGASSQVISHSGEGKEKWIDVSEIDGMFMATQYDLFLDDDRSPYMKFREAGYRIVVPSVSKENRWVFYDVRKCTDRVGKMYLANEKVGIKSNHVWEVFDEEVIYLLRRIYLGADDAAWQKIWEKLYAGNITLKMLQVMTMVCVGNSKKLWYRLLAYLEEELRSLLLQGQILKMEGLLLQLDGEARGKLGNIVLFMIQVFCSEVKKEVSPTVLDLSQDLDELVEHYVHLKYYFRRLEFSLPETYWQEVYDYIVATKVSDYLVFHMLQKDIFRKKEFCLSMAEMFARFEGEQSVRARLYLQLAENEA